MPPQPDVTVGIDLGDRHSHLCLIDTQSGEAIGGGEIPLHPPPEARREAL